MQTLTPFSYIFINHCYRLVRPTTIIVLQTPHHGMYLKDLTQEEVMYVYLNAKIARRGYLIAPDVVCAIGIISLTIISLYLSPFSFPLSLSLSLIRQHQEKKRL